MKKTLLLLLGTLGSLSAQTLQSDNFNSLSVGNIGTDLTGATAGQGGFLTYILAAGTNASFQVVVEGGAYGNVIQMTGSNTASNTRYMWKNGLPTTWAARTSGNDVIQVEYDFFTGPTSTSKNQIRMVIYDVTGAKILAGLTMTQDTKIIQGMANYNNAGTIGNYVFNLGAAGATLPLTANTWVKVGFTFNFSTGEVIWRGPGFYSGITGAAAGTAPDELDYMLTAGTSNTATSTAKFDNILVRALVTESILSNDNFALITIEPISVFPNPVKDILNINAISTISKVSIVDINGRVIRTIAVNDISKQIDISDLKSGIYMLNFETQEGVYVKKIIKE
jgi:hypothetical protein